jgi:hypothetical protein
MHSIRSAILLIALAAWSVPGRGQSVPRWTVDAVPVLDVTGTTPGGDVAFGTASWATRLTSGGVVIADAAAPGLQYFDASGKLVRQVGRQGQGPSELITASWVGRCGPGQLYVWDWIQRRLVQFDTAGTYHRTIAVSEPGSPYTIACSTTGVFAVLGIPQRQNMERTASGTTASVVSGASSLVLADSSGRVHATVGEFSPGELVAGAGAEGIRPLGRWTSFSFGTDRLYVGTAETPVVEVFTMDGKRTGSVRVPVTPRVPTRALQEAAINDLALAVPKRFRDMAKAQMRDIPLPKQLPPYRNITVDPDGLLWVVLSESGEPETRLMAFNDGRPVAEVVVPNGMRVFEVGRDYVLGAHEDPTGEQHVQVWRLRRQARTAR